METSAATQDSLILMDAVGFDQPVKVISNSGVVVCMTMASGDRSTDPLPFTVCAGMPDSGVPLELSTWTVADW